MNAWLGGAPFGDSNIGDPVKLSAGETRFNILALKASGSTAKPGLVDILKHIDVDNCIEVILDFAGDERHTAAARTDVKRGSASSECVLRHKCGVAYSDYQSRTWIGCPDAAVSDAEGTTACPRRNLRRCAFPFKFEADVAAMAFAVDDHTGL